jgi:hypothetical protein
MYFPWFGGQQPEFRRRGHDGSVSRARQLLAGRAMADRAPFRIDNDLESNRTAVTPAVDFHLCILLLSFAD